MIAVRLRSRDGLERIQVEKTASLSTLKDLISEKVERPLEQISISTDQSILTSKSPETFLDLTEDDQSLSDLGFKHGEMVYCRYDGTREVDPGHKKSVFGSRPFGVHMDVTQLMAKQVRMERQDKPNISAVSFDRFAAHSFQAYVQSALAFSIKRCGLLYGRIDEENVVFVDAIYEPEQQGKAETMTFDLTTEQVSRADAIASMLGMQRVGLIFNQSTCEKEEYIMNNEEVYQICELSAEVGEHCVVAVFSMLEEDGQKEVHLEAYQCSNQAVKLWKEGWFCKPGDEVSGESHLQNPNDPSDKLPVMISGKDTDTVDNDFFLVAVAVRDHEGPLFTSYAVENRLTGQTSTELKEHLQKLKARPYAERLADFHALLWLADNSGLSMTVDIPVIVDAVKEKSQVPEGYQMMIDSVAGL